MRLPTAKAAGFVAVGVFLGRLLRGALVAAPATGPPKLAVDFQPAPNRIAAPFAGPGLGRARTWAGVPAACAALRESPGVGGGAIGIFCPGGVGRWAAEATTASDGDLLQLWHDALAHLGGDVAVLVHALDIASRTSVVSHGRALTIWAAAGDTGARLAVQEHLAEDQYGLRTANLSGDAVVVDLGSNLGVTVLMLSLQPDPPRVFAVEASPATWLYQQLNLWSNLPRAMLVGGHVVSVWGAISDSDKGALDLVYDPAASAAAGFWRRPSKAGMTFRVPRQRLSTLLSAHGLTFDIDLLKMDCEGCEFELIPDIPGDDWAKIKRVVGEVHGQWMGRMRPATSVEDFCLRRLCARGNPASWYAGNAIANADWCERFV